MARHSEVKLDEHSLITSNLIKQHSAASSDTVDADEIREARWFTRAELAAVAESGEIKLPSGISISRSLVEAWYGGELPGSW